MRPSVARFTPWLVAALCLSCSDSTAPSSILETATVTDPTGDTFGVQGTFWDLTSMTVSRDTSAIIVRLDFTTTAVSAMKSIASGMIAYVDFDTDQNSETGAFP